MQEVLTSFPVWLVHWKTTHMSTGIRHPTCRPMCFNKRRWKKKNTGQKNSHTGQDSWTCEISSLNSCRSRTSGEPLLYPEGVRKHDWTNQGPLRGCRLATNESSCHDKTKQEKNYRVACQGQQLQQISRQGIDHGTGSPITIKVVTSQSRLSPGYFPEIYCYWSLKKKNTPGATDPSTEHSMGNNISDGRVRICSNASPASWRGDLDKQKRIIEAWRRWQRTFITFYWVYFVRREPLANWQCYERPGS